MDLTDSDRDALEAAIVDVARRVDSSAARLDPILKSMKEKPLSALRLLGRLGDPAALPTIRTALKSEDEETRKEAVRALSNWPGPETIDDLLALIAEDDAFAKTMAARGLMRLLPPLLRIGPVASHDGRLSTERAWTLDEVRRLTADLPSHELRRRFPFRFSLVLSTGRPRRA